MARTAQHDPDGVAVVDGCCQGLLAISPFGPFVDTAALPGDSTVETLSNRSQAVLFKAHGHRTAVVRQHGERREARQTVGIGLAIAVGNEHPLTCARVVLIDNLHPDHGVFLVGTCAHEHHARHALIGLQGEHRAVEVVRGQQVGTVVEALALPGQAVVSRHEQAALQAQGIDFLGRGTCQPSHTLGVAAVVGTAVPSAVARGRDVPEAVAVEHEHFVATLDQIVNGIGAEPLSHLNLGVSNRHVGLHVVHLGIAARYVGAEEQHAVAGGEHALVPQQAKGRTTLGHLFPGEGIAVLLVHVHGDHVAAIGNAGIAVDAQLQGLAQVERVGAGVRHDAVEQAVLRAKVHGHDAAVLCSHGCEHARHVGAQRQRVDVIDESLLLVNREFIRRTSHGCRVGAVLAFRAGGVQRARHRAQRERRDARVVVERHDRVLVLQASGEHSEHREQQSEDYQSIFHICIRSIFSVISHFSLQI